MENTKLVRFDEYCPKCRHYSEPDHNDICNFCLENPARENSKRPINFRDIRAENLAYNRKEASAH